MIPPLVAEMICQISMNLNMGTLVALVYGVSMSTMRPLPIVLPSPGLIMLLLKPVLKIFFQTLYHSFDGDTQAQAFLQNSQEKWKNTLFLDLATEFIWAKIVKFINLSTLQPCTLTGKQRLALPTTESCLQDGTIIKQRPCVRLHDKDIQKITTYMPHSAWFLRYQDTLKNRTNEALCRPIITKKYSPSV